jgi:DNA-directed RNA polymerase subunit E'/Rpb7
MEGPYINTELSTTISLVPNQMNNELYINLKQNLEKQVLKKCLRNYGYITQIYEIISYKNGIIEAENLLGSAKFDITFSCRLCKPLRTTQIVCKIDRINKVMLTAVNGPILIIITNDRVNYNTFFLDNNNNIRYKTPEGSQLLAKGDHIIVTIHRIKFDDGDTNIKTIGFLDEIANEKEKSTFYEQQYNNGDKTVKYEEYITNI